MRHNDDLCPKFHMKRDLVTNSFEKYRNVTYDIRGIDSHETYIIYAQIMKKMKLKNTFVSK